MRTWLLAAMVGIFSSAPAQAVIVHGEIHGTIMRGSDRAADDVPPTFGIRGDLTGEAIQIEFRYDTVLAPLYASRIGQMSYGGDAWVDWMDTWVTINGMTVAVDTGFRDSGHAPYEIITISNNVPVVDPTFFVRDAIYLYEEDGDQNAECENRFGCRYNELYVKIVDTGTDWISSMELPLNLDLPDLSHIESARGSLSYFFTSDRVVIEHSVSADFDLHSIKAWTVPIPATLALFLIGLVGLFSVRQGV